MGIDLMPCDEACGEPAIRVTEVLDSALDAVVSIDINGRIIVWNGQAEKLFGWSREEVHGRALEDIIIPEELIAAHRLGLKRFVETGYGPVVGKALEIEALHRSGKRIPVQLSITPIRIEQDAAGFTAFIRDLSYVKERQRKLEVSDERLQMVLDGSDQGFWDIRLVDKGSALSSRCSTMLGYASGALANGPPADAAEMHPGDKEHVQLLWDDHLQGRMPKFDVTYRLRAADGSWRTVRDVGDIIQRCEDGKPTRIVGTRTDVTDRQKLETALLASQKLECLGSVASGFAHDLNNILAAISGHASLAADLDTLSPRMAESIGIIQLAVTRAKSLTENMMALGRPGEGQQRDAPIMDCIESTLALLRSSIGSDIEIVTEFELGFNERVLMDISHFQQSLINLVLNARDAIDSTGRIAINVRPVKHGLEEWVRIEISDTGAGISAEDVPHVFEPFFTTKKPGQGTGIGLAVVKVFVEATGGMVDFDSRVGEGTCFQVELPLQVPGPVSNVSGDPGTPLRALRVLLVEDHELLRPMLAEAIAADGHTVECFESAVGVLESECVLNDSVDVLVVDVNLGDTNGVELTGEIESYLGHPVPTIYSTGNPDSVAMCSLKPWQKVLRKPFDIDQLLRVIRSTIRDHVASS